MGLRDKYAKKLAEQGFKPLELTGENVQAIFNRCLRKEESKEIARAALFSRIMGYSEEKELVVDFDEDALLKNERNIRYLYGQLSAVHTGKGLKYRLATADFSTNYQENVWHSGEAAVLELLYLGCNKAVALSYPFSKAKNDTTVISKDIKPTLSPKDPNFPEWWEAHKSEWEDR